MNHGLHDGRENINQQTYFSSDLSGKPLLIVRWLHQTIF